MVLGACYAMSGMPCTGCAVLSWRMVLRTSDGIAVLRWGIVLRSCCYGMCGTELRRMALPVCYAESGTELAYGPTRQYTASTLSGSTAVLRVQWRCVFGRVAPYPSAVPHSP
eukprot:2004682-Rhodomonas_salina.1